MFNRTPSPVPSGVVHHQIPEDPAVELWEAWWTVAETTYPAERHVTTPRPGASRAQPQAS